MAEQSQTEATIPHGEEIVERFGGIRPMAAKLEVPVTTVQGWKKRDAIPLSRRDDIITAASQYNISLKGLVSADNIANQNARIEEDPALRSVSSSSSSAPSSSASRAANWRSDASGIDLAQIRRAARTTSIWTTVSLLVIVGAAGFVLFGGGESSQNRQLSSLETRVSSIEAQGPSAGSTLSSTLDATISDLQGQIRSLTNAVGATGQDLAASGQTLVQRLAALEQQLSGNPGAQNLQGAVQQMQNMAGSAQGAANWQAAIEELRGVVSGLQGHVDTLDSALAQSKTQNDALSQSLTNVTGRDLSAAAMLLALTQLRQSVDRQTPFTDDLALLHDVTAKADPDLAASVDRMAPYAQSGVLSSQGLKKELQGLSNDIITAKLKGEDVSLKDRIAARLQGLFSLKKDGLPVTGGEERELIAKASAQLDKDDVQGAMATLQQLQGPAAEAAAPWQQQAQATVAVQAIDQQLVTSLMNKIKTMSSASMGSIGGGSVTTNAAPIDMTPQQPQTDMQAQPQAAAPMPAPQAQPDQSPQSPVVIQQ